MNEPQTPDSPEPVQPASTDAASVTSASERREFLRLLGLGLVAVGGVPLGQSLLMRSAAAHPLPSNPTTLTKSRTSSQTFAGTIPRTITFSGVQTPAEPPGTFTRTGPPDPSIPFTETAVWPGPGGTTQPVTLAGTYWFSYTPPATNTQTVSWTGNSYTITNIRTPSFFTCTMTTSQTVSYTSTTPSDGDDENGDDDADNGPWQAKVGDAAQPSIVVDAIEGLGTALFDPQSRHGRASCLRFACGAGR